MLTGRKTLCGGGNATQEDSVWRVRFLVFDDQQDTSFGLGLALEEGVEHTGVIVRVEPVTPPRIFPTPDSVQNGLAECGEVGQGFAHDFGPGIVSECGAMRRPFVDGEQRRSASETPVFFF